MKFLLGPGNNSLSHILKCIAIKDCLLVRGHDVYIAATQRHAAFLEQSGCPHYILPDIQEGDNGSFPSFKWFSNPGRITDCIRAQTALLERLRPDRVLGVFNFTFNVSSRLAGIPYDSLICGCMLKESNDILGFHGDEPDLVTQKINVDTFFSFATRKLNRSLKETAESKIDDIRDLLKGDMTFLWDFPEFMPLPPMENMLYVGPISYQRKDSSRSDERISFGSKNPIAVISFGTCSGHPAVLERLTRICLNAGFDVVIAAGGQAKYLSMFQEEPRVRICLFPDLQHLLQGASLLITHGGQITVFEALKLRVPVLVMPFQPEQAHNGICLERMGCGRLLIPPRPFRAGPKVYMDAFENMTDRVVADQIHHLRNSSTIDANLLDAQNSLENYSGAQKLVSMLERPLTCPSV